MEIRRIPNWDGTKESTELYHHGIKGQKWGVRRYQNPDGSLTAAGRNRYKEYAGGDRFYRVGGGLYGAAQKVHQNDIRKGVIKAVKGAEDYEDAKSRVAKSLRDNMDINDLNTFRNAKEAYDKKTKVYEKAEAYEDHNERKLFEHLQKKYGNGPSEARTKEVAEYYGNKRQNDVKLYEMWNETRRATDTYINTIGKLSLELTGKKHIKRKIRLKDGTKIRVDQLVTSAAHKIYTDKLPSYEDIYKKVPK